MPKVINFPEVSSLTPGYKIPLLNASGDEAKVAYQNFQPYGLIFRVGRLSTYSIGAASNEPIEWDNQIYDTNDFAGWSGVNYSYTIPVTGIWFFQLQLTPTGGTTLTSKTTVALYAYPATSGHLLKWTGADTTVQVPLRAVGLVPLAAGTEIYTRVETATDGVAFSAAEADSSWTGMLVSPQFWGVI